MTGDDGSDNAFQNEYKIIFDDKQWELRGMKKKSTSHQAFI